MPSLSESQQKVVGLSKLENSQIQKLQEQLRKDPKSPVFVTLAESYREQKEFDKAEKTVREGLTLNPNSTSGLVTLARILKDQKKFKMALEYLNLVTEKKPDNILAQVMRGEIFLLMKEAKKALACYKLVLFYNPTHPMALKAISKLESLTADEYEDDLFEMEKLTQITETTQRHTKESSDSDKSPSEREEPSATQPPSRAMERLLSLSDAYIVRQEFDKALQLLKQGLKDFSHQPEIQKRLLNLEKRNQPNSFFNDISRENLKPLASREEWVRQKKRERLDRLLQRVEALRLN